MELAVVVVEWQQAVEHERRQQCWERRLEKAPQLELQQKQQMG
jgi:hypothetical protein